jgi:hypothetical protein
MGEMIAQELYDIYVINNAGLPLFSGCTATDYCKMHMGQHELVSGFISAMMAFSRESFQDSTLESLLFDDITVNFTRDEEKGLIFNFVHKRDIDQEEIRKNLDKAAEIFLKHYGDEVDRSYVEEAIFAGYRDLLKEEKIIPDLSNIIGAQMETEERLGRRPRLSAWIRNWGNRIRK